MYAKTKAKIYHSIVKNQDSFQETARMRNNHKSAVNTLRSLTIVMILTSSIPKTFIAVLLGVIISEKRSNRDGLSLDNDLLKICFVFVNNVIYFRNTLTVFIYYRYIKAFRIFVKSFIGRNLKFAN